MKNPQLDREVQFFLRKKKRIELASRVIENMSNLRSMSDEEIRLRSLERNIPDTLKLKLDEIEGLNKYPTGVVEEVYPLRFEQLKERIYNRTISEGEYLWFITSTPEQIVNYWDEEVALRHESEEISFSVSLNQEDCLDPIDYRSLTSDQAHVFALVDTRSPKFAKLTWNKIKGGKR